MQDRYVGRGWLGVVVMLSVGRLGPAGGAYYCSQVAGGAEDYYIGAGEAPGRWTGSGLAALGLSEGDTVSDDGFLAVLAGRHPYTSSQLVAEIDRRVPGLDLTFSAPKSVSLLWSLHPDELVRKTVSAAHDRAVADALRFVESDALRARRGRGGLQRVRVEGLVAAGFGHRASRTGDPQLHTHVVAANLVQDHTGRWSAFDTRAIYRHARAAGHIYQARLRHELTTALGVRWGPLRSGQADVAGVSRETIEAFSARRAQILDALDQRGLSSQAAARVATLQTRPTKTVTAGEGLFERWRHQAAQLRIDTESLVHEGRQPTLPAGVVWRLAGSDGLTAQRSSFDRRDTMIALASAQPEGATLERLETLAGELACRAGTVEVTNPGTDSPMRRWTTVDLVATEADLLRLADRAVHLGTGVANPEAVAAAIEARPQLNDEQRAMVQGVCTAAAGVVCVVGKAGAGKTFGLDAARAAWQADGTVVVGAALSARAAAELQAGSGIASGTLASLLGNLDRPEGRPPGGSVIVIDEAAMVGTRDLHRLARHATANRWKLVLVGDPRQLPEISAGGSYRALSEKVPTWTLATNIRQAELWERAALDQLRERRARPAVAAWISRGRVTVAETAGQLREQMIGNWHDLRHCGRSVVMLAVRRTDVEQLNVAAQQARLDNGELDAASGVVIDGRRFMAGDEVLCIRNDRRAGLINGTRLTTTTIDAHNGLIVTVDKSGREVTVPWGYAAAGYLQLSYATTVHKAQGATYDHALLLGDDRLFAEAGYVGLSRGREANRLYVVAATLAASNGSGLDAHPDIDRLITALGASRAQHLSTTDTPAHRDLAGRPLGELIKDRELLAQRLAQTMPANPAPRLALIAETRQTIQAAPPGARWTSQAQAQLEADARAATQLAYQRETWAAEHRRDGEHLARLTATIDNRLRDLDATVAVDPPQGIVEVLGKPPEHPLLRERWNQTALRVAAWCQISGQHPQDLGVDRRGPDSYPERAWWTGAVAALDHHRHDLELEHSKEKGLAL